MRDKYLGIRKASYIGGGLHGKNSREMKSYSSKKMGSMRSRESTIAV